MEGGQQTSYSRDQHYLGDYKKAAIKNHSRNDVDISETISNIIFKVALRDVRR